MLVFDPTVVRRYILLSKPRPLTDFQTKVPVTDAEGKQVFRVQVLVVQQDGRPAVITVKVPAAPDVLEEGSPVSLEALSGVLYERDGRQGVSFRARKITAAVLAGGK